MWSSIVASGLKIVEYLLSFFVKRSNNADITTNELNKKIIAEKQKHNELIERAKKGDKKALDEIRKEISL